MRARLDRLRLRFRVLVEVVPVAPPGRAMAPAPDIDTALTKAVCSRSRPLYRPRQKFSSCCGVMGGECSTVQSHARIVVSFVPASLVGFFCSQCGYSFCPLDVVSQVRTVSLAERLERVTAPVHFDCRDPECGRVSH